MIYDIKAIPTRYAGVNFRSRLEARWAAFFDLAKWKWRYEPIDLPGWIPDFWVSLPCGHSECGPTHDLLVEVKPTLLNFDRGYAGELPDDLKAHAIAKWFGGWKGPDGCPLPCDAVALFGLDPENTSWCMVHGAGGGFESVCSWMTYGTDIHGMWAEAGNLVQWRPS